MPHRQGYFEGNMKPLLLLGAGFSRNWGGWLASEAFEYLLGHPEIINDKSLKDVLWLHNQRLLGFEYALAGIRSYSGTSSKYAKQTDQLEKAIIDMFADMNSSFSKIAPFSPLLQNFLAKFEAIFTLNQDMLLEGHYTSGNGVSYGEFTYSTQTFISPGNKWHGLDVPGVQNPNFKGGTAHKKLIFEENWEPIDSKNFAVREKYQPYFKLHGSANWRTKDGKDLLIMGTDKKNDIKKHELLNWYFSIFKKSLFKKNVRLMVIGYSFRDRHINQILRQAVKNHDLKIFIIDPSGADTINQNNTYNYNDDDGKPITYTDREALELSRALIGASRRTLLETFKEPNIEYDKIMRFFND